MPDFLYHSTPPQGRTDIDPSKYVPQGMTRERKQELDHMSDKEYFNAVLNMTPEIRSALMASEQERIRTFSARWPIEDIIKGVDIAKEGFFFTGNADRVECAFCRGVLRNWERGDDPRTLHKDNFTYCSFAQGRESSNIPAKAGFLLSRQLMRNTRLVDGADRNNQRVGDLGINITKPDNFQFSIENVRKKSFVNFPSHCPVNPADLAEAGFYYSGDGDRVKCFFCAGILGSWMVGDQPWVEHTKWFPGCAFVVQQKGWSYVKKIRESMTPEEKKMSGEYNYNSMSASILDDIAPSKNIPLENRPYVSACMELGYSAETVQKALEFKKGDFSNLNEILEVVFAIEDGRISSLESSNSEKNRAEFESMDVEEAETRSTTLRSIISNTGDLSEKDSVTLVEISKCRLCKRNTVGSVILPCGCFVLCQPCAELERLPRRCPQCTGLVRGAVRTYLA